MSLNLPTSIGKLVGLVCLAAGGAKLFGFLAIRASATDLFLLGLLASSVLP